MKTVFLVLLVVKPLLIGLAKLRDLELLGLMVELRLIFRYLILTKILEINILLSFKEVLTHILHYMKRNMI